MSDRVEQADIGDATLAADFVRWSADPDLAHIFVTRPGIVFALDARTERVVGVIGDDSASRSAITAGDGVIRRGIRLAGYVPPAGVRLVRLRLDTRGIARPTACLLARATTRAGGPVILLAPIEKLPPFGVAATRSAEVTEPEPVETPAGKLPAAQSHRFTWRSDAHGVLAQISGESAVDATRLAGRSWHELGESQVVVGDGLFAAFEDRKTFRALPVVIRQRDPSCEIAIELSGAPMARANSPFSGFAGFGVVREVRPLDEPVAAAPDSSPVVEPSADPATAPPTSHGRSPPTETKDAAQASGSVPTDETVPHGEPAEQTAAASELPSDVSRDAAEQVALDAPEPSAGNDVPALRGADLSTNEHAAFREIARALGARFAGDDDRTSPDAPPSHEGRGAVMAFPGNPAPSTNSAIDAAIVAALDRLPAGVLVHRDTAILYVNRRFLGLTGYADREKLQANGILQQLLGRMPPPVDGITPDMPVSVTAASGAPMPLLVERSRVEWDGGPAELLLVRAAAQAEAAREQIARGLRDARDTARERDARDLLDHIEEGVATLDHAGRLLTVNASAKAILSSEAREIVGAALADVFSPESESALAEALDAARGNGVSAPFETALRADGHKAPLRLRIARLSDESTARFCVTMRETSVPSPPSPLRVEPEAVFRANFLARVSEEIRAPVRAMLDRAEALLAEKLGAVGNERSGEQLRGIHQSGEHVLGVMDDFLDLARIEAGRGDLTFRDIALNDVVSGCIALMQPQAARDRIVVRTSLSPDLSPLVADERSVRQATLNVLANAIRLTEAGGQVIVSTAAERGEIAFRVRDTGIGMTEDEIQRALAPYSRSEAAGERNGTGLALTLSKALVEANRGRFRITSRKNEGTLVEMLFPQPQALSA